MKNNRTNNKTIIRVACALLAVLFVLLGLSSIAPVFAADESDGSEELPASVVMYVHGIEMTYPVERGDNGILLIYPCEHSCLVCGRCTADTVCNTVASLSLKCTCETPTVPVSAPATFKSNVASVVINNYSATDNASGMFYGNVRSALGYRELYGIYVLSGGQKESAKITLTVTEDEYAKLKEEKAEFCWVKNAEMKFIENYELGSNTNTVTFTAESDGAYVVSSHLFNQCIEGDGTFVSDATCTVPKTFILSCSCGAISDNKNDIFYSGEANGHDFQTNEVLKEATCTNEGKQNRICAVCSFKQEELLPVRGHLYKKTVLTRAPSESVEGIVSSKCDYCGELYTEPVPRITEDTEVEKTEKGVDKKVVYILVAAASVLWIAQIGATVYFFKRRKKAM